MFEPCLNGACIHSGAMHRRVFADHLEEFDLFIYHEDDIVVHTSHLSSFMHHTRRLYALLGEDGIKNHLIGQQCSIGTMRFIDDGNECNAGFSRYRRLYRGDIHAAFDENDVIEQELMEEVRSVVLTMEVNIMVHALTRLQYTIMCVWARTRRSPTSTSPATFIRACSCSPGQ